MIAGTLQKKTNNVGRTGLSAGTFAFLVLPHQKFGAAQSFSLVSEKRYLWFWW
jgi:hypothetical protein